MGGSGTAPKDYGGLLPVPGTVEGSGGISQFFGRQRVEGPFHQKNRLFPLQQFRLKQRRWASFFIEVSLFVHSPPNDSPGTGQDHTVLLWIVAKAKPGDRV